MLQYTHSEQGIQLDSMVILFNLMGKELSA